MADLQIETSEDPDRARRMDTAINDYVEVAKAQGLGADEFGSTLALAAVKMGRRNRISLEEAIKLFTELMRLYWKDYDDAECG